MVQFESEPLLSKYRSSTEMMFDILRSLRQRRKLLRIMYSTNVNGARVQAFLNALMERGMVEKLPPEKTDSKTKAFYKSTLKGRQFLAKWDELTRFWNGEIEENP